MNKRGDIFKDQFERLRTHVGHVVPDPQPHPPREYAGDLAKLGVKTFASIATPSRHPVAQALDEGQLVGELLEWLFDQHLLHAGTRREGLTMLQQQFFKSRE